MIERFQVEPGTLNLNGTDLISCLSTTDSGRLARSHPDRCFQYPDKSREFEADLSDVAKKLLLNIYFHKIV